MRTVSALAFLLSAISLGASAYAQPTTRSAAQPASRPARSEAAPATRPARIEGATRAPAAQSSPAVVREREPAARDETPRAGQIPTSQPDSWPPVGGAASRAPRLEVVVPQNKLLDAISMPHIDLPATTWFAIVIILALTVTSRPLLTARTFDGLLLALTCMALGYRNNTICSYGAWTAQDMSYAFLTAAAGYWVLRGIVLLRATAAPRVEAGVSDAPLLILAVAGMVLAFSSMSEAPVSGSSRAALVGGVHLLHTGKLPYGDFPGYDSESPLVYAVHAGAAALMEPNVDIGGELAPLTLDRMADWNTPHWWEFATLGAARLVNAVVFLLTLFGVLLLGRRLHSPAMGLTLAALLCVFPGVIECLGRPDVMLPAMLLTWTLTFAMIPMIGGLLATLCLVLAGVAWPWAWVGLPMLIAYCFRRGGVSGLGAVGGLAGGAALVLFGLASLTAPSIPRADGAVAAAGVQPGFSARRGDDGAIMVERVATPASAPATTLKSRVWTYLLEQESVAVATSGGGAGSARISFGPGASGQSVLYRGLDATPEARAALQRSYRTTLTATGTAPIWPAVRTVLESTWLPSAPRESFVTPAWTLWAGPEGERAERMTLLRRIGKGVCVALALLLSLMLLGCPTAQVYQLSGGVMAICGVSLICSGAGAATNWVWLYIPLLTSFAVHGQMPGVASAGSSAAPGPRPSTSPRISVER